MNSRDHASAFLESLRSGKVCLHPTDTIPGLTADPNHPAAMATLQAVKGRLSSKPLLGLTSSWETATRWWEDLPGNWSAILKNIWPAPLTVIWKGRKDAPVGVCSERGTVGIRVPDFRHGSEWMRIVLTNLSHPLPSTSVNPAGSAPLVTWESAVRFLKESPFKDNVFIPAAAPSHNGNLPSTLIELDPQGAVKVIRPGAFPIFNLLEHLDDPCIILASASPRRLDMLRTCFGMVHQMNPDILEEPAPGESPTAYVERNSILKASAITTMMISPDFLAPKQAVIIAADTIVVSRGKILEKPKDPDHAFTMLTELSGSTHQVITGVSLLTLGGARKTFSVVTDVTFRHLDTDEIKAYIATGEPFDKAGGYGIQGHAQSMVLNLSGSYTNVVGLPLAETITAIRGLLGP